jgi:hypothetical protein
LVAVQVQVPERELESEPELQALVEGPLVELAEASVGVVVAHLYYP